MYEDLERPPGSDRRKGRFRRWLDPIDEFLTRGIWSPDLSKMPLPRALAYKAVRIVYLALRGFVDDRCMVRASALTYITFLSIVPLLAFAFSVAKGLGAYDRLVEDSIHPFLDSTFGPSAAEPLVVVADGSESTVQGGAEVRQAIDQLLEFVKETDFASLGFVGLAILLYAVIKLLGSVEHSLNDIWGVRKSRSFVRKLSDYLSMVVVVPILLVTATGITAAIQKGGVGQFDTTSLAPLVRYLVRLAPVLAIWLGFSFLYLFMPNARTRISSALLGGLVGGFLWQMVQIGHVNFQLGVANYNAIYASFAALPIFLVWIYFSWITVLLGGEFAFAHQNEPTYRQIARSRHHDHAFREVLAVRLMARVGARFVTGHEPATASQLALELGVPERSVELIGHRLEQHGILAVVEEDEETTLLPARDLEQIRVKQILDALKGTAGGVDFPPQGETDRSTDRILRDFEQEMEGSPHNRTARELADAALEVEDLAGRASGTPTDSGSRDTPEAPGSTGTVLSG